MGAEAKLDSEEPWKIPSHRAGTAPSLRSPADPTEPCAVTPPAERRALANHPATPTTVSARLTPLPKALARRGRVSFETEFYVRED